MSNPQNPLDQFRSYSYRHILIATNTTVAAEELNSTKSKFSDFVNGSNDRKLQTTESGNGDYVVIINGFTDADFLIEEVEWYNQMIPSSHAGITTGNAASLEGKFRVYEPVGVDFFNVIQNVCDELQSDPNGLVFFIKTFFIGHTDELGPLKFDKQVYESGSLKNAEVGGGLSSKDVTYINLKPLMFTITDIKSTIDTSGTVYEMEFMSLHNGSANLPIYQSNESITLNVQTVTEAITSLTEKLNEVQKEDKDKQAGDNEPAQAEKGRKIRYVINAEDYNPITPTIKTTSSSYPATSYRIDNVKSHKKDFGDFSPVSLSLGVNTTIEQKIHTIMTSSIQVTDEALGITGISDVYTAYAAKYLKRQGSRGVRTKTTAAGRQDVISATQEAYDGSRKEYDKSIAPNKSEKKGQPPKIRFVYSIQTSVVSTRNEVVVTYTVKRTEVRSTSSAEIFAGTPNKEMDRNSMEFDYIFTGKNVDILDLDIKLDMSLSFFMALKTKDSIPNRDDITKNCDTNSKVAKIHKGASKLTKNGARGRSLSPISAPKKTNSLGTNNRKSTESVNQFHALLSRWAIQESFDVNMKIRGNPLLLNNMLLFPSEASNISDYLTNRKQSSDESDEKITPDWLGAPAYAKVNIKYPISKNVGDPKEISQFWYRGYYTIFSIQNSMKDGEFTQVLNLVALPLETDIIIPTETEGCA